ncbi:hypothetical protein NE865_05709 [Phthorimaea operculella]|nr:hypothetical protein NE865_05709 [Phthorimaea operculella]
MWFGYGVIFIVLNCRIISGQDFESFAIDETTTPYATTYNLEETTTQTENVYDETFALSSEEVSTEALLAEGEKKISETILEMLEHFKKPNAEGIPGVDIPDPYSVPDMRKAVTFFDTLYLENINMYGLKKLKMLYVTADFEKMEVNAAMRIDELQTKGTYRYSSFVMPRQGPFTVNITGLKLTPRGSLGVEIDGKLRTQDIHIDITFDTIQVNFENLGSLGNILQGFINSAGHFIFDNIKPRILQDTYSKAREEMDKKIEEMAGDMKFPNSIAPLDMVLIDARKKVREMGYDPYKVEDYNNADGSYASFSLTNTWVNGLSTFHRIGDISLSLENNTVTANFEIGSQKLEGFTVWEVSAGMMSVTGTASFSVEYISARVIIAQSLDTTKRPLLRKFHLDVGNIQARCDGAGTIDYIIEFVVNILPNLLRYQIIEAIEGPLTRNLQEKLNRIDVEEEIKVSLPRIDEMAKSGFKLSSLRVEDTHDEDEFFNF